MSEKLRIGVIGTGSLGTDHVERLTQRIRNAEVTALFDVFPKKDKFQARYEDSYMDLAKAKDVDAIILTTPNHTHENIMLDIVKVGKPIFCEKPLTNTAEGCKRIIDEEMKAAKPFIQVGFMRRFDPGYVQMFQALRKQDYMGRILMMHSEHNGGMGGVVPDVRIGGIHVEGDFNEVSKQSIPDCPIHDLDTCRWLMNDPDDYYETAQTIWPRQHVEGGASQNPAFYVLKTHKGVVVTIQTWWGLHGQYDIQLEVVCDHGIINYPYFNEPRIRRDGCDGHEIPLNHIVRFREAFDIELQAWVDGILAGRNVSGASAWDAFIDTCACDAMAKSIDTKEIEECAHYETPSFYQI